MNRLEMIEIDEAIKAGDRVLDCIDEVRGYLNSAIRWGMVDVLGDGFISGIIKHSKLKDAQSAMEQLKYELNVFNSELDDVRVEDNVGQLEMSGFVKFADFFLDDFFVDFVVLSRIKDSKRKLDTLEDRVSSIYNYLHELKGR